MINKVILEGRIAGNPIMGTKGGNTPILNIQLLHHEPETRKGKNPGSRDHIMRVLVIVVGKYADVLSKQLYNGQRVIVEGKLFENEWEEDGETYYEKKILAYEVSWDPGAQRRGAE